MWTILCELWISIASLKCIITDYKNSAEEQTKWMNDERIQLGIHSSIKREYKFIEWFNSLKAEGVRLNCHRGCASS